MSGSLKKVLLGTLALALAVTVAACGGSDDASGGDGSGGSLTLVAYSTPQEAYEEIIPAFNETPEGEGVSFEQSYGTVGRPGERDHQPASMPTSRRSRSSPTSRSSSTRSSSRPTGTRTSTTAS